MDSVGSAQQPWARQALPDANAFMNGGETRKVPSKSASEIALVTPENDATGDTAEKPHEFTVFGDDGLTFADLIDVINPLQHIPIVATLYREMTNDTIAAGPRMMGATLFFGPLGFASAVANVTMEEATGKDFGAHMVDWVNPDDETAPDDDAAALAARQTDAASTPATAAAFTQDPVSTWARGEVAWARQQGGKPPLIDGGTPHRIPDAEPFLHQQENWAMASQQIALLNNDIRAASNAYRAAAGLYSTSDTAIVSTADRS